MQNFGGGKFWWIYFNPPKFSPPNLGSAVAYSWINNWLCRIRQKFPRQTCDLYIGMIRQKLTLPKFALYGILTRLYVSVWCFCISVGDKVKLQKIVQMAWTFVNDRYS